jgi:hypothetical protein
MTIMVHMIDMVNSFPQNSSPWHPPHFGFFRPVWTMACLLDQIADDFGV